MNTHSSVAEPAQNQGQWIRGGEFSAGRDISAFRPSGFSHSENAGIWTTGSRSEVTFAGFADEACNAELALDVYPNTVPGLAGTQRLRVLVNNEEVWTGVVVERAEILAPVSAGLLPRGGPVCITFEHPDAIAPSTGGRSTDVRELALLMIGVTLRACPAVPPAAAASEQEVWRGLDGWLFLTGGSNEAIRYYTDPTYFTDADAESWAALLAMRQTRLAEAGQRYLHIGAPDKITVYPELFGAEMPYYSCHPLARLADALRRSGDVCLLVDPLDAFAAHPERDLLYMKTDTHWSYRAAAVVLQLVLERLGHDRQVDLAARVLRYYPHQGDLGAKLTPPETSQFLFVEPLAGVDRVFANDLAVQFERDVKLGLPVTHNSICAVFRNGNPDAIDETVVVFGDSFMDFQASNTTVLFAEFFREVHFIWSPGIDYDYVRRVRATLVITELAERFMRSLPSDDYSLAAATFAGAL